MAHMIQNIYFSREAWEALARLNGPSISGKVCEAVLRWETVQPAVMELELINEALREQVKRTKKEIRRLRKVIRDRMRELGHHLEYVDDWGHAGDDEE